MISGIITKLQAELSAGIKTETQVVYLMAQIRKIIEQEQSGDKFDFLFFHCNWVLHPQMDRQFAQAILDKFNQAHIHMVQGIQLTDLPPSLRKELDPIFSMDMFRYQLITFLQSHGLSWKELSDIFVWSAFIKLYISIIRDCPLVIQSSKTDSYIKKVEVDYIEADMKHHGYNFYYKISWMITDKNGSVGELYILNSYKDSE